MHDQNERRRGRPLTAAKRNAILGAASGIFASSPFDQVLVDEIAHQAGVGKGTLYRYFSSKEDLYLGTVVASLGELRTALDTAVAEGHGPEERLRLVARVLLRHFWDRKLFHALIHREDLDLAKSLPLWEKEREGLRALIARLLAEGERLGHFRRVDPVRAAIFFFSLVRAGNVNRRPGDTPESVGDEIADFYIRGVRTH